MNRNIAIIALVAVAGLSFYGGMKYQQSRTTAALVSRFGQGQFQGGFGQMGGAGRRNGGANFTAGAILSKDAGSAVIELRDGGSKIVRFSPSTEILKTASGTPDDLAIGQQVTVSGTANADGSLTAQSIQVRPAGPRGGRGG